MPRVKTNFIFVVIALCLSSFGLLLLISQQGAADPFSFAVAADMRHFSGPGQYDALQYFRGVCEAIAAVGPGAFMVSPGDVDPPAHVKWTIEQYLGDAYPWYPVVGNHDVNDMQWLREYNADGKSLPHIVNIGPPGCEETTFSFNYQNAHFVVLNQYYDGTSDMGTDGDIVGALYNWLTDDLAATDKAHIFIFGHEPAYPLPDADNGRMRHIGDSLDKYPWHRDRFWNLLRDHGVVAYICGHTHNYSAKKIDGLWQLDAGHARGGGDIGAPSTFLIIKVDGDEIAFTAYRDLHDGNYDYHDIVHSRRTSLPVELASFTARQAKGAVVLRWVMESEIATRGFILQRRGQGTKNWAEIASYRTHLTLMVQDGSSNGDRYKYVDRTVQRGNLYEYRLAVASQDGEIEYVGTVQTE